MEMIIILTLCIIWIILMIFREWKQGKWYKRGYIDACIKYDQEDFYRDKSYTEEAENKFNEDYGFNYP